MRNYGLTNFFYLVLLGVALFLSVLTAQAETVLDNFDSAVYTSNNGTQNWSTDWIELNEADGAAAGDVAITTDSGDTRLQIKSKGAGSGEGVQREADLSGANAATLSFVYRRQALDNANDYVSIEVSGDGGNLWIELDRFTGSATDASYQNASYDITAYIASNTQIRFLSSSTMGKWDIVFFDDVQIDYTMPPAPPHFAISHDGAGSNCVEENITIAFHDTTHTIDSTYTGTITLSTSTATGDWSLVSGSGTLINSGSGAGTYAFNAADNGQVILGLSDTTAATVNINITDGTYSEDVTEDADMVFSNVITNPYADDFSVVSFANSTGTLSWLTDWLEINESDGANSGDVRVSSDALLLRNSNVGIQRGFNTSKAITATLEFDYRRSNMKAGNVVTLEISPDGGSTWVTLDTFLGAANDASYQPVSYNIIAYKALNTRIRFTTSADMATNNRLYVDNVLITMSTPDTCGGIDHFAISISTGGGACDAGNADITITAENYKNNILTGYTGLIDLSISNNRGDWYVLTASGALNNGTADDGAATYQFVAGDNGTITLDLGMSVTATVTVTVQDTSAGVVSTSSGFDLTSGTQSFSIANDSIQVAGRPQVTTVSKLNSDCSVNTGYNDTVPVKAWLTRDGTDPGGIAPAISSVSLPDTEPASDNLSGANELTFVNGVVSVNLDTTDIGKYVLNIKETSHNGNSPTIITRPFAFYISVNDPNANAVDETGTILASAGQTFPATVKALLWENVDDADGVGGLGNGIPDAGADLSNNGVTTSFGGEGATVDLTSSIVAPVAGSNGTLYVNSIGVGNEATSLAGFVNGTHTLNLVWDEVGIIDINANITGNNYWGSGVDVTGTVSNVGRFIPNNFALSAGSITNRSVLACGTTYTYMEEVFTASFTLTAQNSANTTTINYTGVYSKLPISDDSAVAEDLNFGAVNDPSGTPSILTSRLDVAGSPTGSWASGIAAINYPVAVFKNTIEDGSYDLFNIGIAAVDTDGVAMNSFNLDADATPGNDHTAIGSTQIWFGRIALSNAYGSELLDLNVPMFAQYFNGEGFITNTNDICTTPATITISDVSGGDNLDATTDTCVLDTGDPGVSGSGCTTSADADSQYKSPPVVIVIGADPTFNLNLDAPTVGKTGEADITANVPAYMEYDWDGDNVHDNAPSARATFGIYKGKSQIMFMKEGR